MNYRNGKIARIPAVHREELNRRLERFEQSPTLLAWLNGLPEVRQVLREEFGGVPINKQNLSQWRLGGFQEWLVARGFGGGELGLRLARYVIAVGSGAANAKLDLTGTWPVKPVRAPSQTKSSPTGAMKLDNHLKENRLGQSGSVQVKTITANTGQTGLSSQMKTD